MPSLPRSEDSHSGTPESAARLGGFSPSPSQAAAQTSASQGQEHSITPPVPASDPATAESNTTSESTTTPESNAALIASLTRVLAEWTAPDFLMGVTAREGIDLDPGAITMVTVLSHAPKGAMRPSAVASNMVTGASNVSKISARLIKAELVTRIADPDDARAQLLTLTAAGKEVAQAFVRAGNGLVEELLEDWSTQDRTEFQRLLAKFETSSIRFASGLETASEKNIKQSRGESS